MALIPLLVVVIVIVVALGPWRGRERRIGWPSDGLEAQLGRWVAAGVISEDQRSEILVLERRSPPDEVTGPTPMRTPLVAEAIGYVGGALVVGAIAAALGQRWEDLATVGRIGIVALGFVVTAVAGAVVRRRTEPAFVRLTSVLWLLSSGAIAFATGLVAVDVADLGPTGTALGIGLVALAWSALLWSLWHEPLQQVATLAATICVIVAGLGVADLLGDATGNGSMWLLGVAWAVLGHRRLLPPRLLAESAGAALVLVGSLGLAGAFPAWGLPLGLASAAGLVAASIATGVAGFLAFGVVGLFVFVPWAVIEFLGDALGVPVALFLCGILLLGAAAALPRLVGRIRTGRVEPVPTPETAET